MSDISLFYKNIIVEAKEFAKIKHNGQKYGEKDYIYHLDSVYNIGIEFNLDFRYLVAAYLHDTMEDTDTKKIELKNKFGDWIANAVYAVSGFGEGRKARKQNVIEKIKLFEEAIDLKMIDRLANMRESSKNKNIKLLKMYVDEIDDYDSLFIKGNKYIYNEIKLFRYDILLDKTKKCKM